MPVYVYTSGDSAELFLNGKSLGKRAKNPEAEVVRDRYALRWLEVPYEPGELKAVAYQGRRRLGTAIMRTAGEPVALRLTPDQESLAALAPTVAVREEELSRCKQARHARAQRESRWHLLAVYDEVQKERAPG